MSKNIRIIPRLDIKGPNLVKGIHLEGLRVLGKPEQLARYYYESGADELVYMDVVASLYNRNSLLHIIERTAKEIFIPLAVGGGLPTIEDIKAALRSGADKVSLNTAAVKNPEIVREAAKRLGPSTIVISIEAKKHKNGFYEAYTDNDQVRGGKFVLQWAARMEELGAGEILLTSIDHEGTGNGFDLDLTRRVAQSVAIPVIACGGAGKLEDIFEVCTKGEADAVSVASMLHYHFVNALCSEGDYSSEGNIEFLKSGEKFTKVKSATIEAIKRYLIQNGILCRRVEAAP